MLDIRDLSSSQNFVLRPIENRPNVFVMLWPLANSPVLEIFRGWTTNSVLNIYLGGLYQGGLILGEEFVLVYAYQDIKNFDIIDIIGKNIFI